MAIYYSTDYSNRIKETYERLCILMNEAFIPNKCTGVWNLIRRSIRRNNADIPYNDKMFNPYFYSDHCTTIEGMDLICLFFYRKDFLSKEFLSLPNAGRKTIQKLEEVYNRLYRDDN